MFHVSCDWPYAPGWWALLVLQCPHSSFYTVERGRLDGYYSACCGLLGRPSDPTVIADPQLGPLDMKIEQCRDTGYKVGITQSLVNYVLSSNNKVSNWFGRVFFFTYNTVHYTIHFKSSSQGLFGYLLTANASYENDFVDYEFCSNSHSKQEDRHSILTDNDFANFCQEFSRTKKSYL